MTFQNEPFTDFSNADNQLLMRRALEKVRQQLGRTYPLTIDGKKMVSRAWIRSINPAIPQEIIGSVPNASRLQADQALTAAARAYESWSRYVQEDRTQVLRRISVRLRERKFEFAAWLILEVGKNWAEADADVAEAIDFLNYYAQLSLEPPPALTPVSSEINQYVYEPLGPVVVIPPWNFPLAILVGMTMAAVVAGNSVVIKPSSQSPVIAAKFMELLVDAGLPAGVVNLVTGGGGSIGDYLVSDARTRMIAFTGSRAVGLHINRLAAQTAKGQKWVKRVVAEMGGKNAIIVDETADIEQAALAVMLSAFGFQGQKCSACSRVYIHEARYQEFTKLLLAHTSALKGGSPEERENFMGPVISRQALNTIDRYKAMGKRHGKLLTLASPMGGKKDRPGYFVAPTIIAHLPDTSRLWSEEIFGPVLALRPVKSFSEALQLANRSDYGLTGSVYSREETHLAKAAREFFCGNLYLNRKSTGALVGGHPFGGFNMSGTDSKAGGPEYLALFRQAKCISRKY